MRIRLLAISLTLAVTASILSGADHPNLQSEANPGQIPDGDRAHSDKISPADRQLEKNMTVNLCYDFRPAMVIASPFGNAGDEAGLLFSTQGTGDGSGGSSGGSSESTTSSYSRDNTTSLRVGMGFTADPGTFLFALEGDYFLHRNFALGPLLQLGVTGNRLLIAPTFNLKVVFDLPFYGMEYLKPFVQGGLGLAYIKKEDRHGNDDDVGFLINVGWGIDYYVTKNFSVGSNMLLNFLPDDVIDNEFFFSWQVITASFHF